MPTARASHEPRSATRARMTPGARSRAAATSCRLCRRWPGRPRTPRRRTRARRGHVRPITLVLADKDDVVSWGGAENGADGGPEGSDGEKAHRALYPSSDAERAATRRDAYEDADGRRPFVRVRGSPGFDVVAIGVNCNGSLQVFAVGDALVIAGAFCTQDDEDERDFNEEPPPALLDAMTAVAEAETMVVGTVNGPSGKLACLPSTAKSARLVAWLTYRLIVARDQPRSIRSSSRRALTFRASEPRTSSR